MRQGGFYRHFPVFRVCSHGRPGGIEDKERGRANVNVSGVSV